MDTLREEFITNTLVDMMGISMLVKAPPGIPMGTQTVMTLEMGMTTAMAEVCGLVEDTLTDHTTTQMVTLVRLVTPTTPTPTPILLNQTVTGQVVQVE